ncbi:iron complex transport system substrate-binding protein [Desulfitobacterium sp. LBE]|uniref:ABC transporter substrate-binding protein n=1 Tax=Desulfitobacterium sp. LBE TaxID=884086 RepID=UPI00119BB369|nr:ABC transporter substrate-binding protein [Desulfitobacterium sp. LBE]TWH56692.1 iron complex transport system substrate-binding protein [Desulfitobacterium sp. LBE]
MKKVMSMMLAVLILTGILVGCAQKAESNPGEQAPKAPETADSVQGHYPVTVQNFGMSATYEAAPERVVVLSYSQAEIMAALGIEDKIVALTPSMNRIEEVVEKYRETVAGLPVFDSTRLSQYGVPNLEVVLSQSPDFVWGTSYNFRAANCGEPGDYKANNINIYASEGTVVDQPTLENVYNDITNIGIIFNIEDRAAALVEELRSRENAVKKAVAGLEEVLVFTLDDIGEGVYYTTGGATLEDYLIATAGGRNIFSELMTQYPEVSAEEIIMRNPQHVVVTSYFTSGDGQAKQDAIKNSADFIKVTAVTEDNFLILSGLMVWPGLQSLDGLEAIAKTLHPEAFQ